MEVAGSHTTYGENKTSFYGLVLDSAGKEEKGRATGNMVMHNSGGIKRGRKDTV